MRLAATLAATLGIAAAAPPCAAQHPAADSLPLATFAYDRAAPLAAHDSLLRVERGVEVRALRFQSPRGGEATGRLFVPRTPAHPPLAGIVLQHGMPGSAVGMERWGVALARRGAVVVALDAPFARRGGPTLRFTPADSADEVQLVVDLERAVDLLRLRADVDSTRLGYVGVSYGGAIGALLAGVERRLEAYALVVPNGGLLAHFRRGDRWLGTPGRMPGAARERWVAALRPIEPIRFVGRAAPAALLIQSGLRDRQVPPRDARELQDAASEPKTIRWYDGGHGLTPRAEREMFAWVERALR